MKKGIIRLSVMIFLFPMTTLGWAGNGVLATQTVAKEKAVEQAQQVIEQYTRQLILQSVLSEVSDVVQNMMRQGNIQLMPQMAYLAVQQATAEMFKYSTTKQITQDTYRYCFDKAVGDFERGVSQSEIQSNLQQDIKSEIGKLRQERAFIEIIKQMLKNTLEYQSKVMMQYAVQRQTQQILMKQQLMQQAVVNMYQNAIIEAQKQMVAQQAQMNQMKYEWMATQYQQGMMTQYESALRQQQELFTQQLK